jgi:hypothetical protein
MAKPIIRLQIARGHLFVVLAAACVTDIAWRSYRSPPVQS